MVEIKWDKRISDSLAIIIVLIFSVIVAWFTIVSGENIIKNSKDSPAFNVINRSKITLPDLGTVSMEGTKNKTER